MGNNTSLAAKLGQGFNEQEARQIWEKYDKNKNGILEQREANKLIRDYLTAHKGNADFCSQIDTKTIDEIFKKLDSNGTGVLEWTELTKGMRKLGIAIKEESLVKRVKGGLIDTDHYNQALEKEGTPLLRDIIYDQGHVRKKILGNKARIGTVFVELLQASGVEYEGLPGSIPSPSKCYAVLETALTRREHWAHGPVRTQDNWVEDGRVVWNERFELPVCKFELPVSKSVDKGQAGTSLKLELFCHKAMSLGKPQKIASLCFSLDELKQEAGLLSGLVEQLEHKKKPADWHPMDNVMYRNVVVDKLDSKVKLNLKLHYIDFLGDADQSYQDTETSRPDAILRQFWPSAPIFSNAHRYAQIQELRSSLDLVINTLKTGDVICWGSSLNTGKVVPDIIHKAISQVTHSNYTHAALVVVTQHPDSGKTLHFHVESTCNSELNTDWLAKTPYRNSILLTSLRERLEYSNASMFVHRLKEPLSPEQSDKLERFLAHMWINDPPFDEPQLIQAGFHRMYLNPCRLKEDWSRLFCSELVSAALKLAGVPEFASVNSSTFAPSDFASAGCFDPVPYVFKLLDEHKEDHSPEADLGTLAARNNELERNNVKLERQLEETVKKIQLQVLQQQRKIQNSAGEGGNTGGSKPATSKGNDVLMAGGTHFKAATTGSDFLKDEDQGPLIITVVEAEDLPKPAGVKAIEPYVKIRTEAGGSGQTWPWAQRRSDGTKPRWKKEIFIKIDESPVTITVKNDVKLRRNIHLAQVTLNPKEIKKYASLGPSVLYTFPLEDVTGRKRTSILSLNTTPQPRKLKAGGKLRLMFRWASANHRPFGRKKLTMKASARVGIVGAGPAGLHLASLLKPLGYKVTILEQTNRYGGKTHSVHDAKGDTVDLGTSFITAGQQAVLRLADQYEVPVKEVVRRAASPDAAAADHVGNLRTVVKTEGGSMVAMSALLEQDLGPEHVPATCKDITELKSGIKAEKVRLAVLRYKKLHSQLFGTYQYAFPPDPEWEDLQEYLDQSFFTFLQINDCRALIPWCTAYLTGLGNNGYAETLPAYYGLMWITPTVIDLNLSHTSHQNAAAPVNFIPSGFQTLWRRMVEEHKLLDEIKYGVHIESIARHGANSKNPIEVQAVITPKERDKSTGGEDKSNISGFFGYHDTKLRKAHGDKETFQFDYLFVTCPFRSILRTLQKPEELEQLIIKPQRAKCLITTQVSCTRSNVENEPPVVVYAHALQSNKPGSLLKTVHSSKLCDDAGDRVEGEEGEEGEESKQGGGEDDSSEEEEEEGYSFVQIPEQDRETYVAYQLFDKAIQSKEDLKRARKNLRADLKLHGFENIKMLKFCPWNTFFRHLDSDAIGNKRYPWQLRDLQGTNNTFWCGSDACFDSVADVINYNLMILERHVYLERRVKSAEETDQSHLQVPK
eukprot:CAMPEP_0175154784 /NCGR_PEP_ID=MMETSP0087-20121206/20572_1 /TAXON_ID=136419 /ORGANISM="Unknown Unknown, Strain D1" /LENGTH=1412 /DNA_ID=CAMNT_0016441787 /DNA_START=44 /DNA_END=4282 /DNA_ORIENTATION=+